MTRHRDLYFIPFHELNLPPSTFLRGNFTYASLPVTHPTHRLACNVVGAAIGELTTLKEKRDYIDEQIDERLRAVAAPKPDAGDFCPDEGHMYLYHQFVSGSSKGSTVGIGYWQRKCRAFGNFFIHFKPDTPPVTIEDTLTDAMLFALLRVREIYRPVKRSPPKSKPNRSARSQPYPRPNTSRSSRNYSPSIVSGTSSNVSTPISTPPRTRSLRGTDARKKKSTRKPRREPEPEVFPDASCPSTPSDLNSPSPINFNDHELALMDKQDNDPGFWDIVGRYRRRAARVAQASATLSPSISRKDTSSGSSSFSSFSVSEMSPVRQSTLSPQKIQSDREASRSRIKEKSITKLGVQRNSVHNVQPSGSATGSASSKAPPVYIDLTHIDSEGSEDGDIEDNGLESDDSTIVVPANSRFVDVHFYLAPNEAPTKITLLDQPTGHLVLYQHEDTLRDHGIVLESHFLLLRSDRIVKGRYNWSWVGWNTSIVTDGIHDNGFIAIKHFGIETEYDN